MNQSPIIKEDKQISEHTNTHTHTHTQTQLGPEALQTIIICFCTTNRPQSMRRTLLQISLIFISERRMSELQGSTTSHLQVNQAALKQGIMGNEGRQSDHLPWENTHTAVQTSSTSCFVILTNSQWDWSWASVLKSSETNRQSGASASGPDSWTRREAAACFYSFFDDDVVTLNLWGRGSGTAPNIHHCFHSWLWENQKRTQEGSKK